MLIQSLSVVLVMLQNHVGDESILAFKEAFFGKIVES
jgi:hypothetical protein